MTDNESAKALALVPAVQKIKDELALYETLLRRWQSKINLVAPNTLDAVWMRHFADSAQVFETAPEASVWIDMGLSLIHI